jgi:ABC-type nitrate/sulfonate/bicarbonate transport system substrate-binding protein
MRNNPLRKDKNEIAQTELLIVPPGSMEQTLLQRQADAAYFYGVGFDRGVRKRFRTEDLFQNFTAGAYVMSNRYLREYPNTSRHIISGMTKAIEWSKTTPRAEVLARFRQIIARRGRNEDDTIVNLWSGFGIAPQGGRCRPGKSLYKHLQPLRAGHPVMSGTLQGESA